MTGRQDNLGNRVSATHNGNTATYTANNLNQYSQRTVPGFFDVSGTATVGTTVTVSTTGGPTDTAARHGNYFFDPYSFSNTATAVTMSVSRQRLTGFAGTVQGETQSTDAEGNTTVSTTGVNRSTKTVTATTTAPGLSNSAVTTVVNGYATGATGFDGLSSSAQYDALGRAFKSIDPRGNAVTTAYYPGTGQVKSVTDAAGNIVSTVGYDSNGRTAWTQDAAGHNTRFAYNLRSQLTNQWGDRTYPLAYAFDATYGDRTTMSTYRNLSAADSVAWPSGGSADNTTWTTDIASGKIWKKTDATGRVVQFDYNVRGQVASRQWARMLASSSTIPVACAYSYDAATGELLTTSYNDSAEAIPTPGVTTHYTRLGQVDSLSDGTGTRTFAYNAATPWRVESEALPAFFGSRLLTRRYETATATGGAFGAITTGTVKGRAVGFDLGSATNTARDLHQAYTISNLGRFAATTTQVGAGTPQDFVYSYTASSSLVNGYTAGGGFAISRDYETQRDLVTRMEAKWGTTSLARFDFTFDNLGQRKTAKQSGSAFADYYTGAAYSGVFNVYAYNARSELQTAVMYRGDTATATPAAADELPARRFEYRYDSIGNRVTAGSTGSANTADDEYTTNALNQYTAKENNTVKVLGVADAAAAVAVSGSPSTTKKDRVWGADVVPANAAGPVQGTATAYTATGGTGTIGTAAKPYFVPAAVQTLAYDADGNLTSDGVWLYTYNAENQLVRMASALPASAGFTRLRLDFKYDYQGRRTEKVSFNLDTTATTARRFLYDGWNLIAELDGTGTNLTRSYTWGLDLTGDLTRAGGVGALVQIYDYASSKTFLPTYDGNGNIVALMNSATGGFAATYEYDPYGNYLRAESFDAAIADNPFRFSTKFTDVETGLVYYGLRYYSPSLGRFVCRDPKEEDGGTNLYAFLRNQAINKWDYLGWSTHGDDDYRDGWGYLGQLDQANEDRAEQIVEAAGGTYYGLSGSWEGTHVLSAAGRQALAEYNDRIRQVGENSRLLADARNLDANSAAGRPLDPAILARVEAAILSVDAYNPSTNPLPYIQRVPDSVANVLGVSGLLNNDRTGFSASFYYNQRTAQYVIAFRGTEPSSFADVRADITQVVGRHTDQYQQAFDLATRAHISLSASFLQNLSFTGHSLGGGLASLAALATNDPAITFNAAGLSAGTLREYGLNSGNANRLITAYYIQGDILSFLQDLIPGVPSALGTRVPLETDQLRAPVGVGKHLMANFIRPKE